MYDEEHPHAPPRSDVRVPPNDTDAEAAVISAVVLLGGRQLPDLEFLLPEHFFSDANRWVYEAITSLAAEGAKVDLVTISRWLKDHDRVGRLGPFGTAYLARIIDATPEAGNVADHARIVVDKWRVRQTIAAAQQIAAEGYGVNGAAPSYLSRALATMVEVTESAQPRQSPWVAGPEIFDAVEPVNWLVPDLYLCAGRPSQFQGYGYSGKTVAAQSLALAVVSGSKVWGRFPCRRGKVLHIDYEQGRRATKRRYKRLAYVMGLAPDDVVDLRICCLPEVRLSDPMAESWLARECEGVALCVIDSLRAAIGGDIDENDSSVRTYIDKLLRVSDRTGCCFVILHHAGKGRGEGDQREAGRGSSAIFDAAGTVLKLDQAKHSEGEAVAVTKVQMSKAAAEASGSKVPDFYLRIEDVPDEAYTDPKAGLRCDCFDGFEPPDPEAALVEARCAQVLEVLQGKGPLSGEEVAALVGGRAGVVRRALVVLQTQGKLVKGARKGRGGGVVWSTL